MSGGAENSNINTIKNENPLVTEAMQKFKVDEKTAEEILQWATEFAQRKFEKWQANTTGCRTPIQL